jgi:hypothetical protein
MHLDQARKADGSRAAAVAKRVSEEAGNIPVLDRGSSIIRE